MLCAKSRNHFVFIFRSLMTIVILSFLSSPEECQYKQPHLPLHWHLLFRSVFCPTIIYNILYLKKKVAKTLRKIASPWTYTTCLPSNFIVIISNRTAFLPLKILANHTTFCYFHYIACMAMSICSPWDQLSYPFLAYWHFSTLNACWKLPCIARISKS